MTDLMTSTEEPTYLAPMIIPVHVVDIDGLEVVNTEVGDRYECFELGPFGANTYLRFRTTDAALLADVLRKRMDDAAGSVFDEREAKARAQMVECPGCRTRIAPDDVSCGSVRCDRIAAMEAAL